MTDKIVGVIDLGSNLTKLVVGKFTGNPEIIHRSIYPTETLANTSMGYFDNDTIAKLGLDIKKCIDEAHRYGCSEIIGIATSAFRTRTNGREVLQEFNKKFGINIELIDGDREAELIYKGAVSCVEIPAYMPVLVMDIGGGSTEYIIGHGSEILWRQSFNYGSTSLTSLFDIQNPLSMTNITGIVSEIAEKSTPLIQAIIKHRPGILIGTTGAFESFAQMLMMEEGSTETPVSGYKFDLNKTRVLISKLIETTYEERLQIPGLLQVRAGTAHIAAIILQHLLVQEPVVEMRLSLCDVKEGLLLEFFESN